MDQRIRLARRLVEYRKAAGLIQKEAADLTGVSTTSLCHWERGIFSPSAEDLEKLLAVYNKKISDLHPGYVPVVLLPPLKISNTGEIVKFKEELRSFDEHLHNLIEVLYGMAKASQ